MASLRRWRILAAVTALWVLAWWYFMGEKSGYPSDTGGGFTKPRPAADRPKTPAAVNDGQLHWSKRPDHFPVTSYKPLPTGRPPTAIPAIQRRPAPLESKEERAVRETRRAAVKGSFARSWGGYTAHAWMHDEVTPLSAQARDHFGGWAATLVDALDTLWIMGLEGDFRRAVQAAADIDFSTTTDVAINVFETTIRYLGGFLAAYELSDKQYPVLLEKAVEVGELLMCAFDTPNRMPISRWIWKDYVSGKRQTAADVMLLSELGSFSLEFTKLSQLTGDLKYYDAVQRVANVLEEHQTLTKLPGMWPVQISAAKPSFSSDGTFTLGGMSDSLYEYFPKQYLLLGGALEQPRKLYENFVDVAKKHLFRRALNKDNIPLIISGDAKVGGSKSMAEVTNVPRGQHLTCFAGGMIGIGARIFNRADELDVAVQLTDACVWAYNSTASGIGPEIFTFVACGGINDDQTGEKCVYSEQKWHAAIQRITHPNNKDADVQDEEVRQQIEGTIRNRRLPPGMLEIYDKKYILRPEAIESVFVMYRITGDPAWMEKAWQMFLRIEQHTKTTIGAASLEDVTRSDPTQVDRMESFWLAETLKYFYLIFSDWDTVDLDTWVLNTEAHPLRRPDK